MYNNAEFRSPDDVFVIREHLMRPEQIRLLA